MTIDDLLHQLVQREASDLHLRVGEPPVMRVHGALQRLQMPILNDQSLYDLIHPVMNVEKQVRFEQTMELDTSYSVPGLSRFRVNVFRQQGHVGCVMRVIPFRVRTIDELSMPQVTKSIAMLPRGLVLVTGPTGSGKSTSLAAMIDLINELKSRHIVTIEDPIEYVHSDKLCTINQREVGADTHSFAAALKHVMRQNPDVILVGEMRDLETIELAVTAAETGHLVFATLHTTDAPQTIDRIIDVFEPEGQQQIRMQLSTVLQAVISQTLMVRKDGMGRCAAFEIMICTPAIRTLIREGKTHQINTDIQTGSQFGMQTLDSSLLSLVQSDLINYHEALLKCSNQIDFANRASRLGIDRPDADGYGCMSYSTSSSFRFETMETDFAMVNLDELLEACVYNDGSDLHLKAYSAPIVRINGDLFPLEIDPLTPEEVRRLSLSMLSETQRLRYDEELELDFAYEIKGLARFRGNLYQQRGVCGAAFRVIPYQNTNT